MKATTTWRFCDGRRERNSQADALVRAGVERKNMFEEEFSPKGNVQSQLRASLIQEGSWSFDGPVPLSGWMECLQH